MKRPKCFEVWRELHDSLNGSDHCHVTQDTGEKTHGLPTHLVLRMTVLLSFCIQNFTSSLTLLRQTGHAELNYIRHSLLTRAMVILIQPMVEICFKV